MSCLPKSIALAAAWLLAAVPLPSAAQSFPSRPVSMLIGFAAGGSTDISTRALAAELTSLLGQTVIVENRPGAGGLIAMDAVAKAPPDGHTLGVAFVGISPVLPMSTDPAIIAALGRLAYVSRMATVESLIVAKKDLAADTLQQVIALAKANPGKMNYGHGATNGGYHLFGAMLARRAGVQMTDVPYKGDAPAVQALMAGEIELSVATVATAGPQIRAGRIKPIVSLGATRSLLFPDVPTTIESGFPGFSFALTQVIAAPPATPAPVVGALNGALNKALDSARIREEFAKLGMAPVAGGAAETNAFVRGAIENWQKLMDEVKPILK